MYKEIIRESCVRTTRRDIIQHDKWAPVDILSGEWVPRPDQTLGLWWPLDRFGVWRDGRSDGADSSDGGRNNGYGVCACEICWRCFVSVMGL